MPHLPDHVTHDPELIAAYAAGDAAGPALDQAADLVASCTECAELHRDLRAISTALPELPAPVRPRDFRLTPEQAASLRPAGWRGVLGGFAAPRFRLVAPLGTGLAAAGLAGLLLASPGGLLPRATGEAASGSAPSAAGAPAVQADQASGAAASAAAGAQPVDGVATDPERYLSVDVANASAAASAGLAQLPQPGAHAPDASAPAASAMPETLNAMGTAPTAGEASGRTSNLAAPSAGASAPVNERAPEVAPSEPAQAAPTVPGPEAAVAPTTESPAIPVLATLMLVVGLALVGLRLLARRLA